MSLLNNRFIRLLNNGYLRARNAADSADVDVIKLNSSNIIEFASTPQVSGSNLLTAAAAAGSFATTTLNNLGTTSINNHLLPSSTDIRNLGASNNRWLHTYSQGISVGNSVNGVINVVSSSGSTYGTLSANNTTPSGVGTGLTVRAETGLPLGLVTSNVTGLSSAGVHIESGTTNSGSSGAITLQSGTGPTRGKIKFKDGTEGTAGHIWTSTGTDGEGAWSAAAAVGANTALSNLAATSVNQNLVPDAMANNRTLGRSGNSATNPKWASIHLQNTGSAITINSNNITETLTIGAVSLTNTGISGYGLNSAITDNLLQATAQRTLQNSGAIAAETGNYQGTTLGQKSGMISFRTGNATAANGGTGNIILQTGTITSGGDRGYIDFNALFAFLPKQSADPTHASLASGAVYYNTTDNKIKMYNGTTWETVTSI